MLRDGVSENATVSRQYYRQHAINPIVHSRAQGVLRFCSYSGRAVPQIIFRASLECGRVVSECKGDERRTRLHVCIFNARKHLQIRDPCFNDGLSNSTLQP